MDTLKNKRFLTYGYLSRYNGAPVFYDTLNNKDCMGIIKDMSPDTVSFSHPVKETDTLDALALKYYNNPTYWWVIAMFNNIQDAFIDLYGNYTVLQIPNLATVGFTANKR